MTRALLFLGIAAGAFIATFWWLSRTSPIVIDDANLLSQDELEFIATYHSYLIEDHDIDYHVVTTDADASILEQAVSLFQELQVGSQSETGRGLLLLINPARNLVRLEVGFTLEGVFPDAFISYIENRQMVPFFENNQVANGILATTELIIDRAQRNIEIGGIDSSEIWLSGSGGAGAQTAARIGAGARAAANNDSAAVARQLSLISPEATLSAYFRAMDRRDASPSLPIYSAQTGNLLRDRTVTPAQMDSIVRAYRNCNPEAARYNSTGELAVIRYAPAQRQCAPWFFVKSPSGWQLDLATLSSAIRFGRSNAWRIGDQGLGQYAFAFTDWSFDENGFPRP